jgi:hypothetical protein
MLSSEIPKEDKTTLRLQAGEQRKKHVDQQAMQGLLAHKNLCY